MALVKTSELEGIALDWAVAACWGYKPKEAVALVATGRYSPTVKWLQCGVIIESEGIQLNVSEDKKEWTASSWGYKDTQKANSPLVAAMRCYVAIKLGDKVNIPEEFV